MSEHNGKNSKPDPAAPPPVRWGPASWWRAGIAAFALLIALLLIARLFG
ncbi:MAG: hypothetical protein AAFO70_01510 [Pseudomonadota bacterium]